MMALAHDVAMGRGIRGELGKLELRAQPMELTAKG